MTVKIPHWNVLLFSENCLRTKEYIDVIKKISNKGKIFSLLILRQTNELNGLIPSETICNSFGLKYSTKKKTIENTKKYMRGLFPVVGFYLDRKDNKTKEWFYHSIVIDIEDAKSNFTQLPCDLLKVPGIHSDLLVIFTILNYYKTKHNNLDINPSHKTIAKMAGCSERKVYTLLKEGEELKLWKYEAIKGTRSTNLYSISYYDKDGIECYYFRDELNRIEMEKQSIENYLNEKKAENS